MADPSVLYGLGGLLIGGGGAGGLLSALFSRNRDKNTQEMTEVQFGFSVLKDTIAELRADKAALAEENKELRAQLSKQQKGRGT